MKQLYLSLDLISEEATTNIPLLLDGCFHHAEHFSLRLPFRVLTLVEKNDAMTEIHSRIWDGTNRSQSETAVSIVNIFLLGDGENSLDLREAGWKQWEVG